MYHRFPVIISLLHSYLNFPLNIFIRPNSNQFQAHLQQQQQQQQQAAAVQQQRLMMQQSLFMAQNAVSSGSSSGPLSYLEKSTDNLPSGGTR